MTGIRLPGVTTADDGFWKSCPATDDEQERAAVAYVRRRVEDADLILDVLGLTDVARAMRPASDGSAA
jgi:hypothetical protein